MSGWDDVVQFPLRVAVGMIQVRDARWDQFAYIRSDCCVSNVSKNGRIKLSRI